MKIYQAQVVRFSEYGISVWKGELFKDYNKAEEDMKDIMDKNASTFPQDEQKGVVALIFVEE